ncbi:hypothetical protein [Pseudomonas sp.]|uniref:hypothetical protein n=1 Tax=Pseudomonas sp. TaxID=306 RepID=UPI003BB5B9FE
MDDHQSVALLRNQLYPLQPGVGGSVRRETATNVRNISRGIEGVPLVLRLTLVDAMTAEPVAGALVRIEQRIGADTLCGTQATDSKGIVRFTSLYPDRLSGGASCIAMTVGIAGDDQSPQAHHEAWTGKLHLPCACGCEVTADDASRLLLQAIGSESLEDGYFGCLTIGVDTFAVSSQISLAGYDKCTEAVF